MKRLRLTKQGQFFGFLNLNPVGVFFSTTP